MNKFKEWITGLRADNWFKIFLVALIGAVLSQSIAAFLSWRREVETAAKEAKESNDRISEDVQTLVNFLLANEGALEIAPPPITATRMKKLEFVRGVQHIRHNEKLVALSQQIPELSELSDVNDWHSALNAHKQIERATHLNFATFWAQSTWKQFAQKQKDEIKRQNRDGDSREVASFPVVVLYAAPQLDGLVPIVRNTVDKVDGIFLEKSPKSLARTSYPVVDLAKAPKGEHPGHGFFVPSFSSLQAVGVFTTDSPSPPPPEPKKLNIRN